MIPSATNRVVATAATLLLALALAACGADAETAETEETTGADLAISADDSTDERADDTDDPDGDDPVDSSDTEEAASEIGAGYLGSYVLVDEAFGTMVTVTVDGQTRTIETNAIPDHETGDFPNSGNPNAISEQELRYEYPLQGTYVGDATFAMVPGVAVNGVSFEPGTAESVTCGSGETYRIEALQDLYNLGLDFNNAHVQPTGKYHYHGVSDLLVNAYASDDDLVHVGFAADGFLIYYSKSGAFSSGYQLSSDARTGTDCVASGPAGGDGVALAGTTPDGTYVSDWVYVDGAGDLDECNGVTIDGQYAYIVTNEYPYITRCLNGEYTGGGPGAGGAPGQGEAPGQGQGGAPGQGQGGAPGQGQGQAPDLTEAAEALGVTVEELMDALGGPPPDIASAAETLGITVEELTAVLPAP